MPHLKRRDVLKAGLAAAAGFTLPSCGAPRPSGRPRRKPNVLLLWTDQQRFDTLAANGNTEIATPNLDRLAARSAVFERCYVTQAVCTPSRSTVMTGLYPHQNGCIANNIPLKADTPCLPELLADDDYATGYLGKWHLGDEIFAQHGFREWEATEYYEAYYSAGRDPKAKPTYYHWLREKGYEPDQYDRFGRKYVTTLPIEHTRPSFLAERAKAFMGRHRDEPWILSVNYLEPHHPLNGPLNDLHDPEEITPSANIWDDLDANEPLKWRVEAHGKPEKAAAWRDGNAKKAREALQIYWGMVAQVDRSVGAILAELERLGMADDTVILFTSDHGDMMGSHLLGGKSKPYEESARVPFTLHLPGMTRQTRVSQPVCNIDLVPTMLDALGSGAGEGLPGQSLLPLVTGGAVAEDHVFYEWNNAGKEPKVRYLVNAFASKEETKRAKMADSRTVVSPDGFKLTRYTADAPQLYHLAKDPLETTNVIDRLEHRAVVRRLDRRLAVWQDATGDTCELPLG